MEPQEIPVIITATDPYMPDNKAYLFLDGSEYSWVSSVVRGTVFSSVMDAMNFIHKTFTMEEMDRNLITPVYFQPHTIRSMMESLREI